ncbi:hypothetical protein ACFLZ2_00180 [Candidatus Margulisiibacteriota bacterium]
MNPKKKKNNTVLLISSLVTAALLISIAAAYFTVQKFNKGGRQGGAEKAYYLAEAGLNRAVWYLNTPESQGGKGIKWRTEGAVEEFYPGTYFIVITDGGADGDVKVTSVGSFEGHSKMISQTLIRNQLPSAFDYALFSNSAIHIESGCNIYGDVYGRENININFPSKVEDGYVYAGRGRIVSGSGDYRVGGAGTIFYIPKADYAFYNDRISGAATIESKVKGNKKYIDLDLSKDIYIDGNVEVSGQVFGSGSLVAKGDIKTKNAIIHGGAKFIAGGKIEIEDSTSDDKNCLFYAGRNMYIKGTSSLKGSLIVRSGELVSDGNVSIYGIVYCAGNICKLKQKVKIYGSIVASKFDTLKENVVIHHDPAAFPDMPPPGLAAKILSKKTDSKREL